MVIFKGLKENVLKELKEFMLTMSQQKGNLNWEMEIIF